MLAARSEWNSDLTDTQWECIKDDFPAGKNAGRPRSYEVRQIVTAIFYLVRNGCSWRGLPRDYPPWQTVYRYFGHWRESGLWETTLQKLNEAVRVKHGKHRHPSAVMIDSQSVKASAGEARGFDGHKKVLGRKRNVLTDTLGLIQALEVRAANEHDGIAGVELIKNHWPKFYCNRCKIIWADAGYMGTFAREVPTLHAVKLSIQQRRPFGSQGRAYKKRKLRGIEALGPKRWIIERTFAWLNNFRRLRNDYEKTTAQSEAMVRVAAIIIDLRKLRPVGRK